MAIYARLENGTYVEVTGVYKTDGTEVTEIFQGDRLVYSASNELYGSLPLYYNGQGYDLTDYLISGNAVQDGTPSPDAPVDATGSGVRTEQLIPQPFFSIPRLLDGVTWTVASDYKITATGTTEQGTNFYLRNSDFSLSAGTYTLKITGKHIGMTLILRDKDAGQNLTTISSSSGDVYKTFTVNSNTGACSLYFNVSSAGAVVDIDCGVMLNLGSTALPYEPYGFKLPLTVNSTEYPIYLGQVPTTRRIKKLVLTGEEGWTITSNSVLRIGLSGQLRPSTPICTHYLGSNASAWSNVPDKSVTVSISGYLAILDTAYTAVADFKAYLAQQYANGTPVTVWYVLAEPETGVVNEPLMKIGDYADTISFAQAGVTIPTVNGANILDMASPVKPSETCIKGKGIKPMGYGQLTDVNGVNILDKDGKPIYVHGQ